jgi:hypothetical protein
MTSDEFDRGEVLASQEELGTLFRSTSSWLEQHVEITFSPDFVFRAFHEDGLPIITGEGVERLVIVPGKSVSQIVPEAAATLDLGESLQLMYYSPHYRYADAAQGSLDFIEPECYFSIQKSENSLVKDEVFSILDEGERNDVTERWVGSRDQPNLEINSYSATIDATALSRKLGFDRITSAECQALQEIVDHLDDIMGLA